MAAPKSSSYDPEFLTDCWIANSNSHEKAHLIDSYARYTPEIGWRAILSVLRHPRALQNSNLPSNALEMLISRYGDFFIDRIEREAATSPAFKACLAEIHPSPVFPLPEHLWLRLSAAAGRPVGPMRKGMASLYSKIPDLAEVATKDMNPLDPSKVPDLSDAELLEHAAAYREYHESFWAWEELNRIIEEVGPDTAWPLILRLVEKGSDAVLGAVGAGVLEELLDRYSVDVIERIEAQARRDSRFRLCLSHVWPSAMPAEIWQRVVVARGDEPQRG